MSDDDDGIKLSRAATENSDIGGIECNLSCNLNSLHIEPTIGDESGDYLLDTSLSDKHAVLVPVCRSRIASWSFAQELEIPVLSGAFAVMLWTCYEGYHALLRDLLKNPEFKSFLTRRADRHQSFGLLIAASHGGHLPIVKELVLANCDVDQRDQHGRSALWFACSEGHLPIVKLLTAVRACAHASSDGITPLHRCCIRDHASVAEHLLQTIFQRCVDLQDTRGRTPLWWACRVGAIHTLRTLIAAGADVNIADAKAVSPFCKAAGKGRVSVLGELVKSGRVAVHSRDVQHRTALFHACKNGQVDAAQYLIDIGMDVNAVDNSGSTPLKIAVERKREEIAVVLIRNNCDVNIPDARGRTALYEACKSSNLELVTMLLAAHANPNLTTVTGATPLLIAARVGAGEIVNALINVGCDIDKVDMDGIGPLYTAAQEGHLEIVTALIASGASLETRSRGDKTALIAASARGHTKVVRRLIESGCNVNLARDNGCTALYCASSHGHVEVSQLLLEAGADPNLQTDQGATALFTACHKGHEDIVQLLLGTCCDMTKTMDGGITPLHVASHHGHDGIVRLLVEAGFEKDQQKNNGSSPLLTASAVGRANVVRVLLAQGCDPNKPDYEGWTPLAVACCGKYEDVAELLINHRCNIHSGPRDITPLHLASRKGLTNTVARLIKEGCVIDEATESGWTALLLATNNGFLDVAKLLLDSGANVNAIAPEQQLNAILVASRKGHTNVAHLLVQRGAHIRDITANLISRFPAESEQFPECVQLLSTYEQLLYPTNPTNNILSERFIRSLPLDVVLGGIPSVMAHQQNVQRIIQTLCMALHPRLGGDSYLRYLSVDLMEMVIQRFVYDQE